MIALIESRYRAYQANTALGLPGFYAELTPLLEAMARVERTALGGWSGLTASYGWPPPKISDRAPCIVGLPGAGGIRSTPVFTEGGAGFPGAEQEQAIAIDRVIIGGPAGPALIDSMACAAALWLPLHFCYAANSTVDGACHGAELTGGTWQELQLGGSAWICLVAHLTVTSYFALPVG